MLFNDDVLFIHVGKTGGMSSTDFLCNVLRPPIYNFVKENSLHVKFGEATNVLGVRHETLSEAIPILKQFNKKIEDFKVILATIRHPYDLQLSHYFHVKKTHERGKKLHPVLLEHLEKGLESFTRNLTYHRHKVKLEDYFLIDGVMPPNVHLIRFENLREEMLAIQEKYGKDVASDEKIDFPHKNVSKRDIEVEDLSDELKDVIYQKYKWVFDNGYYER